MTLPHVPQRDLAALGQRLAHTQGPEYWRSLEELAQTPAFQAWAQNEFAPGAPEWHDPVSRRRFLQLMGASLALAGLTACTRQPEEKIVPYIQAPEGLVPGKPLFFATSMLLGGVAQGVLVESHMGRPTKIEGNPQHPASLGATDALTQASILGLYDPDRSQSVTSAGRISTWSAFLAALSPALESQRLKQGAGLRLLTESVTSPTLGQQCQDVLRLFPRAKWYQYEPVTEDTVLAGTRLAFGASLQPIYHVEAAEVIVALEADFLSTGPGNVRYARDFTRKRQVSASQQAMNRLYVVESTPTLTGTMADHRLPLRPAAIAGLAHALERAVSQGEAAAQESGMPATRWVRAMARDLLQHRGNSLVLAGPHQPPLVHALAHTINSLLGNIGRTVTYVEPVQTHAADHAAALTALGQEMAAGAVDMLVILGSNPVYTAPADLQFAERLAQIPLRIHLGLYHDETAALCHWHVPEAHYLETWGDARAYDGTVNLLQPLIAPLYEGKSAHELLATLLGQSERSAYTIVRQAWEQRYPDREFEPFWRTALHDGVLAGSARVAHPVTLRQEPLPPPTPMPVTPPGVLDIVFRPDPTVWDGRFTNNSWLQELPKPLTKLTWDNAALVSPATAARFALHNEEVVELRYRGRTVRAPIWIMPGQADETVTVHLGYGRWRAGQAGTGTGFNAYALRTSQALWFDTGLVLHKTSERLPLAITQQHHSMEGRPLVRTATLAHFLAHPHFVHEMAHEPGPTLSMYEPHRYDGNAWGMSIDLNACTGCNACVVACQAENNIPVVGKTEVINGREMHWIRLDRYYKGDLHRPETYHQPVLCMHCENAPCETVCPVGATTHSSEGLNDMVYNRCVGTRYCSNNCPYKVRRFNFFQFTDTQTPSLKLQRNPDVTVRTRGVMEKCTYCVQRINEAHIQAKKDDRPIRDGEVVTACQAACPTQAIVFGNINDPQSRVTQAKADPRQYGLLADLNTRPRTTYLARLRNPNPELETGQH